MPQQETEHFSEAIHPLYHPANKPQSDFRETSLEQRFQRDFSGAALSLSRADGWVLGVRDTACGRSTQRETADHPPSPPPR